MSWLRQSEPFRYTRLELGKPPQSLEFDLDMLSPDFYTIMTTSDQGSRYDTFKSNTNGMYVERLP